MPLQTLQSRLIRCCFLFQPPPKVPYLIHSIPPFNSIICRPQLVKTRKGFCLTPTCLRLAARIKEDMNPSLDPCQDFYQYACGGWLKRNQDPPPGRNLWSVQEKVSILELSHVLHSLLMIFVLTLLFFMGGGRGMDICKEIGCWMWKKVIRTRLYHKCI